MRLTFPELGIIAVTRGMLGIGIGLLLADRCEQAPRRAVGWTLFIIGALSTIPLVIDVLGKSEKSTILVNE